MFVAHSDSAIQKHGVRYAESHKAQDFIECRIVGLPDSDLDLAIAGGNGTEVGQVDDRAARHQSRRDTVGNALHDIRSARAWIGAGLRGRRQRGIGGGNPGPFTGSVLPNVAGVEHQTEVSRNPGDNYK